MVKEWGVGGALGQTISGLLGMLDAIGIYGISAGYAVPCCAGLLWRL